jgi:hypothetical protein
MFSETSVRNSDTRYKAPGYIYKSISFLCSTLILSMPESHVAVIEIRNSDTRYKAPGYIYKSISFL